jgi:transglutaminase-like putative cysteine protease
MNTTTPESDTITTPTILHSLEYTTITTVIGDILNSNKQAFISIFNDQAGTDYALDNLGNPVNNLQITSISITDSYTDNTTNEIVNANIKILFNTNGEFINIDDNDIFWYVISSADFPTRKFAFSS